MSAPEPVLRLLGLAARAGAVLSGTERVREAARSGALQFVLVADDISANTRDKLIPLLTSKSVPYREMATRAVLGDAVGRAPASALGITDAGLARKVEQLLGQE